jgi:NIPSNAP.
MQRRQFLTASLATSALALTGDTLATAQSSPSPQTASKREYYQIRRYSLMSGPQSKVTESFFAGALIPALSRMGMGPVGAFRLEIGQETPQFYLLIPGSSPDALATLDLQLAKDDDFLKAAEPYWKATAASPAFQRIESSLLIAFEGWPKITPPAESATKARRIFQLRTYESPSNFEHIRKVEMFHSGEFDYFQRSGCHPVFFGDTLIGSRTPSLTYMLSFPDQAALDAGWAKFRSDPDWKKLSADQHYAFDTIVSNISNLVLSPLSCSQI